MHVESKQKSIILIKSVYCLNAVERIPQGPCSTIYYTIYLLSMFAKFLVHVCAVTSGIGLDGRKCRGLWPLCITNIHHTALKPTMKITCTRNTSCNTVLQTLLSKATYTCHCITRAKKRSMHDLYTRSSSAAPSICLHCGTSPTVSGTAPLPSLTFPDHSVVAFKSALLRFA